jgi:uncharacterized phage protein (TIGR02218 family)
MTVDATMLTHLAQNVTFCIPIWKMTAVDTTVAAYCAHTRGLTFSSVTYTAAPVEATQFTQTVGLDANHVELFGVFDTIVTEQDIQGGKWKNAKIVFEYVAYDPASGAIHPTVVGSVGKMKGQAGKFSLNNGTFKVEFRSLSDLLSQEIGDLTSPIDRNRRPEDLGVSMGSFTFARTVTAFTSRMSFTVGGTAQVNDYFKYGRAEWSTGANAGLKMEIKSSVGNLINLQLPMRGAIANGDTLNLIAGYDGSREQARDKFAAMEAFNGEPDLPGLQAVLKYPE